MAFFLNIACENILQSSNLSVFFIFFFPSQKKAVERKRLNPDSPNLAGSADGLNKTNTLSFEAAGSSGAVRGDASPAKKPCLDTKQVLPGQVPPNQYIQQAPNNQGHGGDGNLVQMQHGAATSDGMIEAAHGANILSIDNNSDVLKLLDDPSDASLDDLMKSGNFNADMIVQELMKLEETLNKQLGEMPADVATNSPSSGDANKQSEMKPETPSNNQDTATTLKTEITDSHDPMMMKGPPNTVAPEAVQKSGPLPGIQEFKSAAVVQGVMIKQEMPQINVSQTVGVMFKEQSAKTVASNGAQNMGPQVAQQTQMQTTFSSAPNMNSSMRLSLVNQQSSMPNQQQNQNYMAAQQQQMNRGQFMSNPRMTTQQNLASHQRVANPILNNTMNNSMSSADQLAQFATNSIRSQSNPSTRLPGIGTFGSNRQTNFAPSNQGMALSGQSGTMMPNQTAQFAQHPTQQRMTNPELMQRLQRPPTYSNDQQRSKLLANFNQSQQAGLTMQQGSSQMLVHRRPPPRYDEARMSFQGAVNPGMQQQQQQQQQQPQQPQQQMGQPQGMVPHMSSSMASQRLQPMASGQNIQGQASSMLANHVNGLGGMTQVSQQEVRLNMQRLRQQQQLRNQMLLQQQQNNTMAMSSGNTQQHPTAVGNQINMGQVPASNMSMSQQGMGQYSRHPQLAGQWTNQMVQRVQQGTNFQGNNMMSQTYTQQSRFPQRNIPGQIMDSSSNMRTFQNMTSQSGVSNAANTNASIMTQQRFMVQSQPAQQQQPQQQPQQTVQANPMASLPNGPAVAATNQSFNGNAQQQMQMGMMPNSTSQQQSGSTDMLDLLDNIIKNEGSSRPNSQT